MKTSSIYHWEPLVIVRMPQMPNRIDEMAEVGHVLEKSVEHFMWVGALLFFEGNNILQKVF